MKKSTKSALGYALLYTFVMVFVTAIPLYSYVSLALSHTQLQQEQELKAYALEVQRAIYGIGPEVTTFVYPRSLLFESAIFDQNGEPLFSLLKEKEVVSGEGTAKLNGRLSHRVLLAPNRLDAHSLVVSRPLSYATVLLDVLMLIGVVGVFVFAFSLLILSRSIQPFEEAARQMDRFFKDAMHELKTPLGVIRLNLEMLGEHIGPHRAISRANSALIALSTIYEDIEYLIKHRRVEYRLESFCASEALLGRVEFFADMIAMKRLHVSHEITPEVMLLLNRQEWQRIVDNTLSNAIKYTPAEGSIHLELLRQGEKVVLCIEDTGVGIGDTEAIFQRYFRGDEIRGGFGIGLSIVREICVKNGIEIQVRSTPGKGSRFCYTFLAL